MAEMVICLLVAIATALGAAGRAVGLLSTLPRTIVDILGAVVDFLGAIVDFLGDRRGYPRGRHEYPWSCHGYPRDCRGYPWGCGDSTSCPSRRHSQPHDPTTGHRYSRCDGRGIRPLP